MTAPATIGTPVDRRRRSRSLLMIAFGAVAMLVITAQVVGYLWSRAVGEAIDVVERNALASVGLVQRMALDVQSERIMIDRHIFEHETARMEPLEREVERIRHDYEAAATAYSPLATFTGEAAAWHQLTADIATLAPHVHDALELSRENEDAAAQRTLAGAEPIYDAVMRDVKALVAINQVAAADGVVLVESLQTRVVELRFALAGATLAIVVLLGVWVTRAIHRREAQIESHALELENRNRELDAFAGRVAHDLRGPLNTIKLSGSMLAESAPAETRTGMILQRGVGQMEQLIEDLLELSRLDTQAVGAVAATSAVAAVIEEELGPVVRDAGGTLRVDVAPARVRCSDGLLRQVLWNLGENAVKYRRPEVALELEISGRASDRDYLLQVTDNASGMPPEVARAAFEPFFRGTHPSSIPGTGLGLSIVRRVIEANGGKVTLRSVPGRGTTVELQLPRDA